MNPAKRPNLVYIGATIGEIVVLDSTPDGGWIVRCTRCNGNPYKLADARSLRYSESREEHVCRKCANQERALRQSQNDRETRTRTRQLYYSLHFDCNYSVDAIARWAKLPASLIFAALIDEQTYRNRG